jgi:hypothetical protein
LPPNAAEYFLKESCNYESLYTVKAWHVIEQNRLKALVVKKTDETRSYTCEILRKEDGSLSILCPCRLFEEMGFSCAHVIRMVNSANTVSHFGHQSYLLIFSSITVGQTGAISSFARPMELVRGILCQIQAAL